MNILIVTSSAQGAASVSNQLADGFAAQLRNAHPGSRIVIRDVGREPLPHLVEATIAGVRAEAASPAEIAARDLSDQLIAEVRDADLVVIASPMYNFGISSTLKAWFDHVLRPRVAFRYTQSGPEGLLGGRKVVVIESRAGSYAPGDPADSQEPHLRQMLGFVGLTDVTFVRAGKLAFDAEASVAEAAATLAGIARQELPLAA
jgi:FMN-dependent NADH-azoreductase